MALLPGTLSRAGRLSSDILDLQVAEHGPGTRVVTVVGEVDAFVAPELASFLTAQTNRRYDRGSGSRWCAVSVICRFARPV